jgi:hypothetical protein
VLHNNRVLLKTASLTDLSVDLSEIHSNAPVIALTTAGALYLGSDFPFNHRYIEVSTPNDQTARISVSTWSGTSWVPVAEVIDQTAVNGVCLAQSGILSWVPDRDASSWSRQAKSADMSDLSTTKIYDLYLVKITVNADLKNTTAIKYVGHKFSTDAHLGVEYPELVRSDIMTAFEAGKTDWLKQTISAAEYIIQELREKGVLISPDQVLDWTLFQKASIHKTAEIIYTPFGEDRAKDRAVAAARYAKSIDLKAYSVDQNANAALDECEKPILSRFCGR